MSHWYLQRWNGAFISAILLVSIPLVLFAQPADDIGSEDVASPHPQFAGELELEKAVAERIEDILQPIIGPLVVMVDVTLSSMPVELQGFTYSQQQSLPGLPVSISENVRSLEQTGWDYNEITGISIRVFVSENMLDEDLDRITEVIPMWIKLDYSRGDQIIVEPVPFVHPPITMVDFLLSWEGLAIGGSAILILAFALGTFMRAFIRRSTVAAGSRGSDGDGGGAGGGIGGPISPASLAAAMSNLSSNAQDNDKSKKDKSPAPAGPATLTFPDEALSVRIVREHDRKKALGALAKIESMSSNHLMQLLENAPPEVCAIALLLAKPNATSDYIETIEESFRNQIFGFWPQLNTMPVDSLNRWVDELKKRIDSIGGGSLELPSGLDKLAEVLNRASDEDATRAIESLDEIDPAYAFLVREKVFLLDDIRNLEAKDLKRILIGVPRDSLAVVVRRASEEVQKFIYENLSSRAADMLQEEVALLGDINQDQAAQAKTKFMESMRRVIWSGM